MNQNNTDQENHFEQESLDNDQEPPEPSFHIPVANEQTSLAVQESKLELAVHSVLEDSEYRHGMISIAVVDDSTIHQINRQFLDHDYPTDVLSFVLEDNCPHLIGELVVSADTAISNSQQYGWSATNELLLYVIHGCLHLVGYLDKDPTDRSRMLAAELDQLKKLDLPLPSDQTRWLSHSIVSDREGSSK